MSGLEIFFSLCVGLVCAIMFWRVHQTSWGLAIDIAIGIAGALIGSVLFLSGGSNSAWGFRPYIPVFSFLAAFFLLTVSRALKDTGKTQ